MGLEWGACQEEVGAGGRGRQGEGEAAELLQRGGSAAAAAAAACCCCCCFLSPLLLLLLAAAAASSLRCCCCCPPAAAAAAELLGMMMMMWEGGECGMRVGEVNDVVDMWQRLCVCHTLTRPLIATEIQFSARKTHSPCRESGLGTRDSGVGTRVGTAREFREFHRNSRIPGILEDWIPENSREFGNSEFQKIGILENSRNSEFPEFQELFREFRIHMGIGNSGIL